MNEITASSILAHIGKSSPAHTPISKPSATLVGTEVAELKQSDHSHTHTSCAMEGGFDAGLAAKKQCTSRLGCTHAQSKKADSNAKSIGIRFMSATLEGDHDSQDPSHSPMPIATANEPKAQDMHGNLQEKLMQKFHQVLENSGMQMLMEVNDAISKDLVYTSQPEEQDPEAWFLSLIVPPNLKTTLTLIFNPCPTLKEAPLLILNPSPTLKETPLHFHLTLFTVLLHGSSLPVVPPDSSLVTQMDKTLDAHLALFHVLSHLVPIHQPPSLTHELTLGGTSNHNCPLCHEDSLMHISTSSKLLGNPIPTPSPPPQPQSKCPLAMPEAPQPTPKWLKPSSAPGGKVYTGCLNMVEINSEWILASGNHSQEVSHQTTSSQQKGKSTACAHATHSQGSGNNLTLLDGPHAGQPMVELAMKEVQTETLDSHKPTTMDLQGFEGAIWKDIIKATWAFSMGEGNFQSCSMYDSWSNRCFAKVIELKVPDLDPDTTIMSNNLKAIILNYLPNSWYQDYLWVCDHIQNYYKLKNPTSANECEATKTKVHKIYLKYFHYCCYEDKKVNPYKGEIMFIALKAMFFFGPKAIGPKYLGLFKRSKELKDKLKYLAVLAYVVTMVQFCLSKWSDGLFNKGTLNATIQHSVWICHFNGLKSVHLLACDQFTRTYNEWVEDAYDESQAQTKYNKKHYIQPMVLPSDMHPNTPSPSPTPHGAH
ncbi:hypothetical protein OPQ81_011866 [Rhizoctonia solani]|nr:hypothetical protein OPQ81_011866 [Rhizoctonia solani]